MRRPFPAILAVVLVLAVVLLASPKTACAYTPDSPEVQAMVDKAIRYIEENAGRGMSRTRTGGACLVGLTIYKHKHDINHPLVQAAIKRCQTVAQKGFSQSETIYDIGIALIFLGEVGPELYRTEAEAILDGMLKIQKPHGGFGYLHGSHAKTGDTSMTQYAVLGIWMADRQNIDVPGDAIEKVCNWLMRTQDPRGGWGYQGHDPGSFQRIKQSPVTLSLSAAGLSSIYVCADLLGLIDRDQRASTLPPAIRIVLSEEEKAKMNERSAQVSVSALTRAAKDGNGWFAKNFNIKADSIYQHYYMYALERYKSFQELVEDVKDEEPEWYNQGVEYLQKTQAANGSWESCEAGAVLDSCFGVLFLLRSTKGSITRIVIEKGILSGGKGLGDNLATARVDSTGKVVTSDAKQAVADLIGMLDDPDAPQKEFSDVPEKLVLSKDPKKREGELSRLRRMAVNGSYKARQLAVDTISTVRDLDSVPALIYALSDPRPSIARAARDALRFMSRKTRGFGMPTTPKNGEKFSRAEYEPAREKWTKWFLSVRPGGELIQ